MHLVTYNNECGLAFFHMRPIYLAEFVTLELHYMKECTIDQELAYAAV